MNVVDSSAWLEYFAGRPNAAFFAPAIEDTVRLVVPTLSLYEVFKRILQQRSEGDALQAIAVMQQGTVVELDAHRPERGARRHRPQAADGGQRDAGNGQDVRGHALDPG